MMNLWDWMIGVEKPKHVPTKEELNAAREELSKALAAQQDAQHRAEVAVQDLPKHINRALAATAQAVSLATDRKPDD